LDGAGALVLELTRGALSFASFFSLGCFGLALAQLEDGAVAALSSKMKSSSISSPVCALMVVILVMINSFSFLSWLTRSVRIPGSDPIAYLFDERD
jgi:hypothetical protein